MLLLLFFLSLANCFQYRYSIPRFNSHGMFPVDVGIEPEGFYLAGFGDFNGDFRTDLIMLSEDKTTVRIYLWDLDKFGFHVNYIEMKQYDEIVNLVASDFDYDGRLDLMLITSNPAQSGLSLKVCFGDGYSLDPNRCSAFDGTTSSKAQPMLVDYFGNKRVQLLGQKSSNSFSAWQVVSEFNRSIIEHPAQNDAFCEIADPNWNAFLDFDGDCAADLFFTCKDGNFKILTNRGQHKFEESFIGKILDDTKSIVFADLNGDGAVDILSIVCKNNWLSTECFIYILYNRRQIGKLCERQELHFNQFDQADVILSLNKILDTNTNLKSSPISGNVFLGDINLDSYPDLMLVLELRNGSSQTVLLENVGCDSVVKSGSCPYDLRGFNIITNGVTSLSSIDSVEQVAFMDLSERGRLDVLLITKANGKLSLKVLFNNFFNDAFFIKAIVTNGVCFKECSNGPPSVKPLGSNYPGATLMLTVFDMNGRKRPALALQYTKTGYFSLSRPYIFTGLGRTNNYIEEFYVGIPGGEIHSWSGIMPNSQLLVHPPTSSTATSVSFEWILELYLSPGDYALNVLITLIISTAFLGMVVGVLRYIEKREDEKDKRRLNSINFDSL